jgi:thiol-disulfide isomerase/thioredoxin
VDRLQHLTKVVCCALLLAACADEKPAPKQEGSSRFASVKSDREVPKAASSFCERVFPIDGAEAKKFVAPPEKAIPGYTATKTVAGRWRWVNLWATWCQPCVEEMALLGKWKQALEKDVAPLELELWSVDGEEKDLVDWLKKPMPGHVRWVKSPDDLNALLGQLGLDKNSAIPIHVLVDAEDRLRCVRVGSVHDADYPAVKALLAQR